MTKNTFLTALFILLSTISFAKYKVAPYVAAGVYGEKQSIGGCAEIGVTLPIYKFITANVFCESFAPFSSSISAYYGLRSGAKLFNGKVQSGRIYCQGTLNLIYDKTFYYSLGYSHSINLSKHFSAQVVPYYSTNTSKKFTEGAFGGVLFFTYSF